MIRCFHSIEQGHKLNVYDVVPAACADLKSEGGTVCGSVQEVAKSSDYVITMLPNNDIVYDTYEQMAHDKVDVDKIFIDSSTIDPNVAKKVQHKFLLFSIHFILISRFQSHLIFRLGPKIS